MAARKQTTPPQNLASLAESGKTARRQHPTVPGYPRIDITDREGNVKGTGRVIAYQSTRKGAPTVQRVEYAPLGESSQMMDGDAFAQIAAALAE